MSKIIITTMEEIPENCCDCPCADHENGRCQADKEGRTTQAYRPFWCPLKEDKAQDSGNAEYLLDGAVLAAVRDDNIEPLRTLNYEVRGKFPSSDEVMWATAYKLCCDSNWMPQKLKDKSRKWLEEHGYKAEIW